jgi:hypothetical protein
VSRAAALDLPSLLPSVRAVPASIGSSALVLVTRPGVVLQCRSLEARRRKIVKAWPMHVRGAVRRPFRPSVGEAAATRALQMTEEQRALNTLLSQGAMNPEGDGSKRETIAVILTVSLLCRLVVCC